MGSEMCIRDSPRSDRGRDRSALRTCRTNESGAGKRRRLREQSLRFFNGALEEAPFESLRLWAIARALGDFAHLPQPGGLYDQHPELLTQWLIITSAFNEFEEDRQRKQRMNRERNRKGREF